MEDIADRIKWVLEHRPLSSQREWSTAAGLSPNVVGHLARGTRGTRTTAETWERLARAAGVDVQWLRLGEGTPTPEERATPSDPYPTRVPVVAMARTMGVPEGAVAALLSERYHSGDPGADYWRRKLREYMHEARDLERDMLPDDDTFGEHEEG